MLSLPVCRSAQYNVAAKMPKAAAISVTTMMSVGIRRLPRFSAREHDAAVPTKGFDPNQIGVAKGVTTAPARDSHQNDSMSATLAQPRMQCPGAKCRCACCCSGEFQHGLSPVSFFCGDLARRADHTRPASTTSVICCRLWRIVLGGRQCKV